MKRAAKVTRPRVLGNGARDVVATGASSGITGAVIVGLLPKIAAALSVVISAVQLFGMIRRAWRKWRGKKPRKPRRCRRCGSRWHTSCADPARKRAKRKKARPKVRHAPDATHVPGDARSVAEALR